MYRILNVPQVTDLINGRVYMGNPPLGVTTENIGINLITNPNRYLQTGVGNVNIYSPLASSGMFNTGRMSEIINVVAPLIQDTKIRTEKGTFHFQISDDKGFFRDDERDGVGFYNLRFQFQTLKKHA